MTHWFGKKNLSRTPSAWFSWGSKPDFRSCRMTVSYPSEMFFSFREKCCYMLIFANEYAVLIESFDNRFEATPFYHILYRWRKFFCFVYMYFVRLASSWWVVARGLSKLVKIIKTPPTISWKSRPTNYSCVSNKRAVANKHPGLKFALKKISVLYLINVLAWI